MRCKDKIAAGSQSLRHALKYESHDVRVAGADLADDDLPGILTVSKGAQKTDRQCLSFFREYLDHGPDVSGHIDQVSIVPGGLQNCLENFAELVRCKPVFDKRAGGQRGRLD